MLVVGALTGLFMLSARGWTDVARQVFSGTPLMLAAVLIAVGVLVQIMALTGVRGWLVINAMSFQSPAIYAALAGLPLLGSVLTSIGVSNSLGVAVRLRVHPSGHDPEYQRAVGDLSPCRILPAHCNLDCARGLCRRYRQLWPIIRAALPHCSLLTVLAVLMLIFNPVLAPYLR